ncbi:transmembrane channel-like protein 1 isoform X1 [Parasteatoda tepidariorum]|uniref:transmembrane channel-like protein 1 isoform X1 n=1 Tax=Parasteatoda tepidariorum TaxID=114398 RepID=UPI0039BD3CB7
MDRRHVNNIHQNRDEYGENIHPFSLRGNSRHPPNSSYQNTVELQEFEGKGNSYVAKMQSRDRTERFVELRAADLPEHSIGLNEQAKKASQHDEVVSHPKRHQSHLSSEYQNEYSFSKRSSSKKDPKLYSQGVAKDVIQTDLHRETPYINKNKKLQPYTNSHNYMESNISVSKLSKNKPKYIESDSFNYEINIEGKQAANLANVDYHKQQDFSRSGIKVSKNYEGNEQKISKVREIKPYYADDGNSARQVNYQEQSLNRRFIQPNNNEHFDDYEDSKYNDRMSARQVSYEEQSVNRRFIQPNKNEPIKEHFHDYQDSKYDDRINARQVSYEEQNLNRKHDYQDSKYDDRINARQVSYEEQNLNRKHDYRDSKYDDRINKRQVSYEEQNLNSRLVQPDRNKQVGEHFSDNQKSNYDDRNSATQVNYKVQDLNMRFVRPVNNQQVGGYSPDYHDTKYDSKNIAGQGNYQEQSVNKRFIQYSDKREHFLDYQGSKRDSHNKKFSETYDSEDKQSTKLSPNTTENYEREPFDQFSEETKYSKVFVDRLESGSSRNKIIYAGNVSKETGARSKVKTINKQEDNCVPERDENFRHHSHHQIVLNDEQRSIRMRPDKHFREYHSGDESVPQYHTDESQNNLSVRISPRKRFNDESNKIESDSISENDTYLKYGDSRQKKDKVMTINDARIFSDTLRLKGKKRNLIPSFMEVEVLNDKRSCWSKKCFSTSRHSHVVSCYENQEALDKKNAILDTIPIHDRQDKSVWLQVNDMWASVQQSTTKFELWHATLKRIEGLHGTGVVSYFVFLRWLIFLNLILFITFLIFITLPHSIFSRVPLKKINYAPNNTFFLEKYNQYPDPRSTPKPLKRTDRLPFDFKNKELISDLGSLLNRYLTNDTIENINYDQRNYTDEQRRKLSEMCESRYKKEELSKSIDVLSGAQDLLQGTGWLQSTILFLGYYTPTQILFFGYPYNMPVAFLCVFFVSSIMCILMMVQYSSHGVQETVLARKSNYLAYSNILFCSWDYCIENKKSSIIRHRSILHEIKSTLAEERRRREVKGWSKSQKFKVHTSRFFLNAFVLAALCGSYYLIYKVVNFQLREMQSHRLQDSGVQTLLVQYLTPVCITSLNIFVPIIFNAIVKFESYNTQTQINIALIRIVFLRLSSVFVLVGLLFQQIVCEPKDDCKVGTLASCQSPICWETYVGQQLYKLAVTDFIVYIMLFLAYDLPRDLLVRSCPNKATQMVGRQVFDLPNQVLSLVYSQTLCWLGMVYSPLIPLITVIKFIILFYIKRVLVLKFCTPPPIPYKASRSNAMFIMILLLSFFSVLIIHGYSLSSLDPSPACSPFRYYSAMVDAIPITLYSESSSLASIVNLIFSGIVLFPAIILLCIAVYYYWTIVIAHRKMIKILKSQIVLEGRDKQFLLNRLTHAAKGHLD